MPEIPPIAVTFARPEESRGLRRRLSARQIARVGECDMVIGQLGDHRIMLAHTGIGPEAAAKAAESLLSGGKIRHVIGAGFAGALAPDLAVGDVVADSRDVSGSPRILSRALPVESAEAKAALHRETGALAVDMETEALASACAKYGVAFTAVRAISDAANEALPVPFAIWFDLRRQRPRVFRLLGWLALHPGRIDPFVRFVRPLGRVSERLADAIEEAIARSLRL